MKHIITIAVLAFFHHHAAAQETGRRFRLADTIFHLHAVYTTPLPLSISEGHALLRPEEKTQLDSIADMILRNPGMVLMIGCHSDQRGSDTANIDFTQKQANTIVTILRSKGIPWTSVVPVGYGERIPIISESDIVKVADMNERESLYRKNRRIEYTVLRPPRPTIDLRNPEVKYGWIDYTMRYKLGKPEIDSVCFPFLDSLAEYLLANPAIHIEVECHIDLRTSPYSSSNLSGNRARKVVDYLIRYGVPGWRLNAKGCGDVRPIVNERMVNIAPGKEGREALHAVNRRTEFRIIQIDAPPVFFNLTDSLFEFNMLYVPCEPLQVRNEGDFESPERKPCVDSIAQFMKAHPEMLFEIQCHTDTRGTDNMKRSQDNSNKIRNYLITHGVDSFSLVACGYGEEAPMWPEVLINREADTLRQEQMQSENRRTLFRIAYIQDSTFLYSDSVFTPGTRHTLYVRYPGNEIKPETTSIPLLDSLAAFLLSHPKIHVEIGQHDGPREWKAMEKCLSCERAHFIRNYLIAKGVSPEHLTAVGYSSSSPQISHTYIRQQLYAAVRNLEYMNQRTEIRITKVDR